MYMCCLLHKLRCNSLIRLHFPVRGIHKRGTCFCAPSRLCSTIQLVWLCNQGDTRMWPFLCAGISSQKTYVLGAVTLMHRFSLNWTKDFYVLGYAEDFVWRLSRKWNFELWWESITLYYTFQLIGPWSLHKCQTQSAQSLFHYLYFRHGDEILGKDSET